MDTNDLKNYFDGLHRDKKDPWDFWKSEYEIRKYNQQVSYIKEFIDSKNILEIGCSTGAHTKIISNRFPNSSITAIDVSEAAISQAKKNLGKSNKIKFVVSEISEYISLNSS